MNDKIMKVSLITFSIKSKIYLHKCSPSFHYKNSLITAKNGKSSVTKLQCQFQGMLPVVYAPRMKVIHAFGGTFPVTEKVIYTFLYLGKMKFRYGTFAQKNYMRMRNFRLLTTFLIK